MWGHAGVGRPPQGQRGRRRCRSLLLRPKRGPSEAAAGRVSRCEDAVREHQVALHHPVGAEAGKQDFVGPHARGFRAHEDPVELTLGGAPHRPDYVRRVAQPVWGPERGQRALWAQDLREPAPSSRPCALLRSLATVLTLAPAVCRKAEGLLTTALRRTAGRAGSRCRLITANTAPWAGWMRTLRLCSWACSRTSDPFRRRACTRVTSPPPREEGPHAHAVRQASQPRGGELSARLLQVGDVGPPTGQVCDEAWDVSGVRPEAAAVGRDHPEAAHVRGAALQVLKRVVRQAEHIRGILFWRARFWGWRLAAGPL